jgi:putative membrane-bound dehydrogenase-like protein
MKIPLLRVCLLWILGITPIDLPGQVDKGIDLTDLPQAAAGFEVNLFAREPMVRNPCSIAFDERGRMFVSHGPQYRNPKPDTPPDSIVILDDADADGMADGVRTFATGFNCIQGLAWHGNDLWVANAPDLTVIRDTDGDDVADEFIRVFTDLGNIEHGLHGLNWAPDGRLYLSKGNSKGVVIRDWKADEPDRIAPKPFRELWGVPGPKGAPDFPAPKSFTRATYKNTYQDPADDWGRMGGILRCEDMGRNLEIVARGLRNPYGLGFDASFDWLGLDQDQNEGDRIVMPFFGAEFGWSHAWSPHWTGENHPPTVPVSGPVFHGSGTGAIFADAPNWPSRYRGVWILNDWLGKQTQVYRPAWQGALMKPEGGQWEDFIIGSKALFRPVDLAFGPDGALCITGWSRGYGVERDQNGNMTNEGRIFRVMPKGSARLRAVPEKQLPALKVAELIAEFSSPLPVRRINAQDELVRRGSVVTGEITAALATPGLPTAAETWAVWTLARIGGNERWLQKTAADSGVSLNRRIQAVRALGFLKSAALPDLLPPLLAETEPRLRFAAIQAAHQANSRASLASLTNHAAAETDRICSYATWKAMRDLGDPGKLSALLADGRGPVRCAALLGLLDLGAANEETLSTFLSDADDTVRAVAQLGLGRRTTESPGLKAARGSRPVSPIASNIQSESRRASATGILQQGEPSYTDRGYVFTKVPASLAGAEMIRTANEDDGSRGDAFLSFDLALASTVLVAHDVRVKERPGWLQPFADSDLAVATNDTQFHLWSRDFPPGKVILGGNLANPSKGAKANYFVVIQPKPLPSLPSPTTIEASLAALTKADPRRGEALFFHSAACSTCHRVGNRGINFGPDLTNLGARLESRSIVQAMLDPNAVITEGFAAHAIEAGGKSYLGVLLSTGRTVRLGLAGGEVAEIPETDITRHDILPVSPMPPMGGLLGPQEVADITAWLTGAKPRTSVGSPPLTVEEKPGRLLIRQGGAKIGEFVFADPVIRRPFFANLLTPGGIPVTRTWPPVPGVDATDHADMHPGVWLGFGRISGQDFWRNRAEMRHESFPALPAWKGDRLEFSSLSGLFSAEGVRMATMRCDFALAPKGSELHLTWDAAITPDMEGFFFGDQEEMGLGVRMATPLTEKNGGLITSSTGKTSAKLTWGQTAEWCDYSGTRNGIRAGVKVIPDPGNFRPCWWHNRDYGVFVANPFGRKAMTRGEESRIDVRRGETFRLKYTILLHADTGSAP